jgi:hypothetical protein
MSHTRGTRCAKGGSEGLVPYPSRKTTSLCFKHLHIHFGQSYKELSSSGINANHSCRVQVRCNMIFEMCLRSNGII